jgi:hypothetical protein
MLTAQISPVGGGTNWGTTGHKCFFSVWIKRGSNVYHLQ